VSRDMLTVAQERMESRNSSRKNDMEIDDQSDDEEEEEGGGMLGDLLHHDMGTGLPFRAATFDACISISALQWLCYSNTNKQVPKKRLVAFFSSLYTVLRRGGRAVLQFYPETAEQAVLISECAAKVGFAGGIVVDYPNSTKAKKHYLVLSFDKSYKPPEGLTDAALLRNKNSVQVDRLFNKKKRSAKKKKSAGKTKDWILDKKEMQRKKGADVRPDTKYTGRRRPKKF